MEVSPTFDMIPVNSNGSCALCHAPWGNDCPDSDGEHISVVDPNDGTGFWHSSCFFTIYTNDPDPALDFLGYGSEEDGADDSSVVVSADESASDDGSGQE